MAIVTIFAVFAVAVGLGLWIGNLGNRDTRRPADSRPSQECEQACNLFQIRQEEACLADKAEKAATGHAVQIAVMIGAFVAITAAFVTAIAGLIAAGALLLTPIAIVILLGVSLIVAAIAVTLFVALASAALIAAKKRQEAIDATQRRGEARSAVLAACTTEQAHQCLSIPFTC